MYDLWLGNIDGATITGNPTGWEPSGRTSVGGFAEWYAPSSSDWLAPGAGPLSGFIVTSPYGPAHTVAWEATTDYGSGTTVYSGEVDGPSELSQPEPGSLCLLGLAVGPVLAWRKRRQLRASEAAAALKA